MAESKSSSTKSSTATAERNGTSKAVAGVMAGAQNAADVVKTTYDRAAERFPEVAETAQTTARDTQRALARMPNQGLIVGTSFSIGLGVGLFMSGANRFLVLAAFAPAAAMAATLIGREEESKTAGA
jgi:hypothetical protein